MREEVADFLHYCRIERRLAEMTCKAYERDVRACLAFLSERGIRDLGLVRPPDLRAFLAAEAERRPALGSQTRAVAALKVFFRFCVENEYLERDPALVLRTPKKREVLPDVLDRRELARLLRVVDRDEVWERNFGGRRERDRLMLALFAFAGLRRSELLGLDWDTSISSGDCCECGRRRAVGSEWSRFTPRSCRCSSTTWRSVRTIPSKRSSSASRATACTRHS
jgi:site-specific recombinase XerD